MVNRTQLAHSAFPVAQAIQDLGVFVAHVDAGVLIRPDQPNYALLQGATVTIKSVLNRVSLGLLSTSQANVQANGNVSDAMGLPDLWNAFENETLDFELDFWTNLAEHPALYQDIA